MVTDEAWCLEFRDIKCHLQKAFVILGQCLAAWQDADKVCKAHIQSVDNLTEQYQCAVKVQTNTLPGMKEFPDVKEKLLFKIASSITKEIAQLEVEIMNLEDLARSFSRQIDRCQECCRRTSSSADIPALLNKTAIYPSIAEMLEWLRNCDRGLLDSSLSKQYLIQTYRPDENNVLTTSWYLGDMKLITHIQDCLAYTNRFMELKFS